MQSKAFIFFAISCFMFGIASTSHSWDGKRKGFILGLGAGLLSGKRELVRLNFQALDRNGREMEISLQEIQLYDSEARAIAMTISDGYSEQEAVPEKYALFQNYPNPFNPEMTIRYELPEDSDVQLEIYNTTGQLIRTLVNEHKDAGSWLAQWDAKDASGRSLPSGVYFYQLTVNQGKWTSTRKLILMK